MNVIEELNNELKNKNWTLEQKARYLYLRSCEIFSFDPRYKFCGIMENGDELEKKLRGYTFDLENVENFEIICESYINNVYPRLLRELLNIEEIYERGSGHKWCEFNDGKRILKADATCSDLTRVKMGLRTHGYYPVIKEYTYHDQLEQIDKEINYRKTEYYDTYIERKINKSLQEYHKTFQNEKSDEYTIFKINILQELREDLECTLNNFCDQEFCLMYLIEKLNIQFDIIPLYHIDEQDKWHFLNIYVTSLQNEKLYYLLEQESNGYNFYEIHKEEALHYARNLKRTSILL